MDTRTAVPDARRRSRSTPSAARRFPRSTRRIPYCDGGYTYYFCSAMCRRFFIDQRDAERRGATNRPAALEVRA